MGVTQETPGGSTGKITLGQDPNASGDQGDEVPTDLLGTSIYGAGSFTGSLYSPGAIAAYYYTNSEGQITPLPVRLQGFRNQYAQTGNATLDEWVLDYRLGLTPGQNWESRGGVGSAEADVQKRRPRPGTKKSPVMTVQGLLEYMRTADSDEVAKWQQLLLQSGYMDPNIYKSPALLQNGVYDQYTQDAWTRLLKDAVMAGDGDVGRTIQRRKDAIDANGGLDAYLGALSASQRDPFVAQLTAAEDIQAVGGQVAQNLIGRGDDQFAEGLVGGYNAAEEAAQRKNYDLQETGGQVIANPDLGAYAEDQLKRQNPTEVGAYAGLGAFNVIMQDLGLAG